jgi:hypothetical protein
VKLPSTERGFPERKFRPYCAPCPSCKAGLAGHVPAKTQSSKLRTEFFLVTRYSKMLSDAKEKMNPHGQSPWSLARYPPTRPGAVALRLSARSRSGGGRARKRQGFGGLSASSEIRRSSRTSAQDRLCNDLRIHPRPKAVHARRSACRQAGVVLCVGG